MLDILGGRVGDGWRVATGLPALGLTEGLSLRTAPQGCVVKKIVL